MDALADAGFASPTAIAKMQCEFKVVQKQLQGTQEELSITKTNNFHYATVAQIEKE
jgi:hypothetical protein